MKLENCPCLHTLLGTYVHLQEEIDPILEPVLSKSFVKRGNSAVIKLGDKEVRFQ